MLLNLNLKITKLFSLILGNEEDFIIPESNDFILQAFRADEAIRQAEKLLNIPFVAVSEISVPLNKNNNESCVICKDQCKTHEFLPCGHHSACADCSSHIDPKRCPICNLDFTIAVQIWI